MKCQDIMKVDVECISPDDSVHDAAQCMRDENIGFLPVCDDAGRVIGTVTDRDLTIRVLAEGKDAVSTKVQDAMTRDVVSCRKADPLKRAEELMADNHKSRIMVLDDDEKLVGVISLSDIAQYESPRRTYALFQQVTEREARA
jgi:CBS domain-containing protein